MNETIVINEGTTFMVTDSLGNVPRGSPLGLFRSDTRYLNKYVLRINGRDMIPLSFTRRGYIANISLTNPELKGPEIPAVPEYPSGPGGDTAHPPDHVHQHQFLREALRQEH